MKNTIIIFCALTISFFLGFMAKSYFPFPANAKEGNTIAQKRDSIVSKKQVPRSNKKATGIGGIFFKCKDPKKMKEWYKTHLGLQTDQYGTVFAWYEGADSTKKGYTQWSPFKETTKYFEPSTASFMINYRVGNLDVLAEQLKKGGVTICDSIERVSYGNFLHIMDPEGNKIELWEPIEDGDFERTGGVTK